MGTHGFKTVALIALPFTALLAGTEASAQWRVVQPQAQQIRYAEMDVNGDGVVTRREWQGTRRAFNAADWNSDGVLSGDEVRLDADDTVGTSGRVDRRAQEFERFDRNGDGILNRNEWTGIPSSFGVFDANRDGVITQREYVAVDDGAGDARAVPRQGAFNRRQAEVVTVDAQERWTPTGIHVNQGDQVLFNSQGTVQLSANGNDMAINAGSTTGRYAAQSPLPDALAGALIGRIGNGAPFAVGNLQQITAPDTGELFLGVNDDHLQDNRGAFRVRVNVR